MDELTKPAKQGRNRAFDESHREMIETAARLIAERGADALSVAALAREMGIDRTTIYYHFASREALMQAVSSWATEQLARGMDLSLSQPFRIGHISRFVLENPALIKLWIDDFASGRHVRESYIRWDDLVSGVRQRFAQEQPGEEVDAEAYCAMMLASAIVGLRVFASTVPEGTPVDTIIERFVREEQRMLRRDGLIPSP